MADWVFNIVQEMAAVKYEYICQSMPQGNAQKIHKSTRNTNISYSFMHLTYSDFMSYFATEEGNIAFWIDISEDRHWQVLSAWCMITCVFCRM
jgi:hypothetical protein